MNKLVQKIADQAKKARFASFEYTTSKGEKARYKIQLGFNYRNLIEKSATELEIESQGMEGESLNAAQELLESFRKSLERSNEGYTKKEVYKPVKDRNGNIVSGLKFNQKDNSLQVFGLISTKLVIDAGNESKSKPTTVKQAIRNNLPIGRFREFNLEQIRIAKLDGEILVLE